MNEELPGQISSLEVEEASLRYKNSQLEREIQQLKLQLQILPEMFEDHLTQLQKKFLEEELHCLEMEKKLPSVCKNVKSTTEDHDLYKKMVEDMGKELKRTNSYHRKEICVREKRAQARGMAAVPTERKLRELRKENGHNRKMLAKVEPSSSLSQGALVLHSQPTGAPKSSGFPGSRRESRFKGSGI